MSLCENSGTTNTTMLVQPAGGYNNGNGNGMWGQDSWWFFIVILALCGGWGNGFGGYGGGYGGAVGPAAQGYDTRADLQRGFDTQNIVGKLDGLNSGLCSLGYDQLAQMNGISANMAAGFAGVNNAVCQLGYNNAQLANGIQMQVATEARALDTNLCQIGNNIAQQFNAQTIAQLQGQNALQAQIAGCCCDVREGISGVNYNNAMQANATQNAINSNFAQTNYNLASQSCETRNTINGAARDIIASQEAGTRAILDRLTAQEIAAKDATIAAQNQRLFAAELAASQNAQNQYLINQLRPCPIPSYPSCNPWGGNCGSGC